MSPEISILEAAEVELNDAADFYDIACVNPGYRPSKKASLLLAKPALV
jgi:hypothetical protein